MLSQCQRATILELHARGLGIRQIARTLRISRPSVRKVLQSQSVQVPLLPREEKAAPFRQEILELLPRCKHNLVRVHEELLAQGADLSYQALTAFCRRHGITQSSPPPAGRYEFELGKEIQHDTSPHKAEIAGKLVNIQTASAVLAYSHMLYVQHYPRFTRFECKCFLTQALRYFDGVPKQILVDNTHVIVLHGTGAHMVPVPEMAAFAERFGFEFVAHEKGDANRSGRVERPMHYIDNNFLAGRTFASWQDLNQRAGIWCDEVNASYKPYIHAVPRELFALERVHLQALPAWIPEVYRLHQRIVDIEGYITLHTNRYSVPVAWIGRHVEVRETQSQIEIQLDARNLVTHERIPEEQHQRVTLAAHRPPRGQGLKHAQTHPEEQAILGRLPEIAEYVEGLKKHSRKLVVLALRQLLRIVREYPLEPLRAAVTEAAQYGLYDLDRLERMILRRIERDFFLLNPDPEKDPHDD